MRFAKPILFAIGFAACLLVAFAAVKAVRLFQDRPPASASGIAIATGEAKLGGPFTLTNHEGRRVTDADFRGRYMLIYFGFAYCPDVCPTELQAMGRALDLIGPEKAKKIVPVFISVDPARDTPAELAKYVKAFHPRMVGLTGTPEEVAAVAKAFRVYYKIGKPSAPGAMDYLVDHTSFLYLVGPDGDFAALYRGGTGAEALAEALEAAVK